MILVVKKTNKHIILYFYFPHIILGPCNERLKPADTLLCENPVCVKPAVCRDTDTCACVEEPGVVQVLQMINSTAVTCVTNGTMLDDSVDTTKVGQFRYCLSVLLYKLQQIVCSFYLDFCMKHASANNENVFSHFKS